MQHGCLKQNFTFELYPPIPRKPATPSPKNARRISAGN